MDFLRLIRFKNLILLVLALLFTRYFYKVNQSISFLNFNAFDFALFVLSIVLIAASGNIINDIFDVKIDAINKPNKQIIGKNISKKNALTLYYILNFLSIVIGIYLSYKLTNIGIALIYLFTIFLLHSYSKKLKGTVLIGNLLIAFLTPLPILVLAYYDIPNSKDKALNLIPVFIFYFFGFLLNLIRELLKDIQDYKGDKQQKIATFTVVYGKERTQKLIQFLSVFTILFLSVIIAFLYKNNLFTAIYLFVFVALPLLYFTWKITTKNSEKHSALLKIIILFGLFSILFIH